MTETHSFDCLTPDGFLRRNALDAAKADFYLDLRCPVCVSSELLASVAEAELRTQLAEVRTVQAIFDEVVVSFLESGSAVLTLCYTALGVALAGASERTETITGRYTISPESDTGSPYYQISLHGENGKEYPFSFHPCDGTVHCSTPLGEILFFPFSTADLLSNSGTGSDIDPRTDSDGTILKDVPYGDGARNRMDVYIPNGFDARNSNGVILFIHGGSWISGGKEDVAGLCHVYARQGYFTAAMNHTYAMTPLGDGRKSTLLTINREVGQAFSKLKALSEDRGWNLTQAALSGFSSGCHIAFLYAYSDGNEPNAPLPVKTVFGMVGCMDFRAEYWTGVTTDGPEVASLGLDDARIISETDPYSEAAYNARMDSISPLAFAKQGNAIPSVIAYAMLDETLIDWRNGIALQEVLTAQNIPNELFLLPNSGHICGNNRVIVRRYQEAVQQFLKTYFGY